MTVLPEEFPWSQFCKEEGRQEGRQEGRKKVGSKPFSLLLRRAMAISMTGWPLRWLVPIEV